MSMMSDNLTTPGFFTNALGMYDTSNPFETEFRDADIDSKPQISQNSVNESFSPFFGFSPRTSPAPNGPKGQNRPQSFHTQDLDGMDLGSPGDWNPAKQMFALDPQHYQQPVSTHRYPRTSPKEFNLDPDLRKASNLKPLATQVSNPTAVVHHGQVTPPSDSTPDVDGSTYPDADQDASRSSTKSKSRSRKRRSTTDNTSSRRRKSSGTTMSGMSVTDQEGEEVDEKRSKFLERNRVAASKCRQKKKEWTNGLEQRARELQNNKAQLTMMVGSLREEMLYLKSEVLKHNNCNCSTMREYLERQVKSITERQPPILPLPSIAHGYGSPIQPKMEMEVESPRSIRSSRQDSISLASPVAEADLGMLLSRQIDDLQ